LAWCNIPHQCRQAVDGVELDDLALLVAVEGGAGNAESGGYFLRLQTGFHAVSTQLLTNFVKSHYFTPQTPDLELISSITLGQSLKNRFIPGRDSVLAAFVDKYKKMSYILRFVLPAR
jgi:hypothetical protein